MIAYVPATPRMMTQAQTPEKECRDDPMHPGRLDVGKLDLDLRLFCWGLGVFVGSKLAKNHLLLALFC